MSEERELLVETLERALEENASAAAPTAWAALESLGIGNLLVGEAAGGFGGSHQDLIAVLRACGRHALALPVGEVILARLLLTQAGLEAAGTVAAVLAEDAGLAPSSSASGVAFSGRLRQVPATLVLDGIVTVVAQQERSIVVRIAAPAGSAEAERTLSGDAQATLTVRDLPVADCGTLERRCDLKLLGAALRVAQMAGAIETLLRLTLEHAANRSQFGRKLGEFQVIQQYLAQMAEESAAATCAATAMGRALDLGDASFEIAAAKLRVNRAVGVTTALAHQIHGAIGCTEEHALHRYTRHLWSWRSEYGTDRDWALELGSQIARGGADRFWNTLTERGDRR